MSNAYELLGVGPNVTRAELDAAYAAKRDTYDPARFADMGREFEQVADVRRAELATAYASLKPMLATPTRLGPADERRRDRQTIWVLLALLVIALSVPLLRNIAVPERTVKAAGADTAALTAQIAPDFELNDLNGTPIKLSDYRGKVVLVNVWATWCPPCVRETPRLVRVYNQYREQGFVLLGVNTTYQDKAEAVAEFARSQQISYPILLDTEGKASEKYASRLMPTSYLIDRNGKIVSIQVGEVDEAQLEEQIRALLVGMTTPS